MKRALFVLLFAGFLAALPLAAQDFTQPKAQFLSFNFGVPIGYDTVKDHNNVVAGGNIGIDFTVIDNFAVGLNMVTLQGKDSENAHTYSTLQFAYNFMPAFGAALGIGTDGDSPAASIGLYADMFQKRASYGITSALRIKIEYFAPTSKFGEGAVLFTTGMSFGI